MLVVVEEIYQSDQMIFVGLVGVEEILVFYGGDQHIGNELAVGSYELLVLCEQAKNPSNTVQNSLSRVEMFVLYILFRVYELILDCYCYLIQYQEQLLLNQQFLTPLRPSNSNNPHKEPLMHIDSKLLTIQETFMRQNIDTLRIKTTLLQSLNILVDLFHHYFPLSTYFLYYLDLLSTDLSLPLISLLFYHQQQISEVLYAKDSSSQKNINQANCG